MENPNVESVNIVGQSHVDNTVLLETGKVTLKHGYRESQAGILMDRGSMSSYIRRDTAQKLGLKPHNTQILHVNGFGGHTSRKAYDVTHVDVVTRDGIKTITVLVTDEIVKPINQQGWAACQEYDYIAQIEDLANDFCDTEFIVDVMIGCDHAFEFLENKIVKGEGPTVQHSNLGCFVSGPLFPTKLVHSAIATSTESTKDVDETENDAEIHSLESFLKANVVQNSGEKVEDWEEQFKQEFIEKIQFKDGHYYVPLPWKPDHPEVANNLEICEARITQVMNRLRKLKLVESYFKVMQENIQKGYVAEVPNKEDTVEGSFIPHFPILRDSETTPVRIVFNASSGSPSLNDCLYEGPIMLQDLVKLLLQFRVHKIGISADIARAFLSIRLLENDRKYVKFLWYKDNDISCLIAVTQ
jgi:hypothetical protein